MDCKLCDYYRDKPIEKCEFAGICFSGDVENMDIEYPCSNMSYDDYINRAKPGKAAVNSYHLNGNDWRYVYMRCHAAKSDRYKRRAV